MNQNPINEDLVNPSLTNIADNYAELHCISNFSFLRGASHPQELVQQACNLGYQALAITDECSLAGVVRAHTHIKDNQLPIKLIIGSEFMIDDHRLVLLAPDLKAYQQLSSLITRARRRDQKGQYRIFFNDLFKYAKDCLLLWSPDLENKNSLNEELRQLGSQIQHYFPDSCWLLWERLLEPQEQYKYQQLQQLSQLSKIPLVCAGQVVMHHAGRQPLQDILSSIRHKKSINQMGSRLYCNAERHLRDQIKIHKLYDKNLIQQTAKIAQRCHFSLDELSYRYPTDVVPANISPINYLKKLVIKGEKKRFPKGTPDKVTALINKELILIEELKYEYYFITIYDIVAFAKKQNILCQGRGSAANSVICYCLGITEVDPNKVNLLFERFISKERLEPPDIDVDFESQRREEVIQYIYRRYGRKRTAIAATVISYKRKSALRDVAKVLELDLGQLEQQIANYGWRYRGENWLDDIMQNSDESDFRLGLFKQAVKEILGFPRHLSQHVGGFVICQGPLSELVPIENAAMADRTVIQWDKDDLESLKLMKVDILSLGMLSAIKKALACIQTDNGNTLKIQQIPKECPQTYRMLQKADSIGVFQVESRAQMSMLPRLKPECFYDLVVQVAIVRPGPIHGDMVHPYLRRRKGLEQVHYPLESLKPVLGRTFGVPIFQEQIIAFSMVAADFSAGEADRLRRAMASWKKKGHMHVLQQRLSSRMADKGFPEDYIQRINRQIEGFGEYGFPESHAASFALLVYVSAWLKCHHPAAFCCALLNSQPMGFYTPSQLIQDAKRHQVNILPVDINLSQWDHQLDGQEQFNQNTQPAVRLGLRLVKGLKKQAGLALVNQRPVEGYQSIQQLQQIQALHKSDLEALASANAMKSINKHRYQARWESMLKPLQADLLQNTLLLDDSQVSIANEIDDLFEDYDSLGLTLARHPLQILREQGLLADDKSADQLVGIHHNSYISVSGIVVCRQRPGTSAGVTFVTLEDETGNINVVVWLDTAQRQLKELVKAKLLRVVGKLEKDLDSGVTHIIAYRLFDISHLAIQLKTQSRNFH